MSGIVGAFGLDGAPPASRSLDGALVALSRRGPDRQRGWSDDRIAMGQTLLATTPEALIETQPWTHAQSGCTIVADSRLDNRGELLRALGLADRAVDTIGDCELLHAAWQLWGEDCCDHLLGDFAFAIWDARSRRLFCARDQMGVRPFYYCHLPQRLFAFASQADALLQLPGVPRKINEGRIADFLISQLEGLDATSTFHESILRLPPAHTLGIDDNGIALRRYWNPIDELPTTLPRSDAEWAEATHAVLAEAVGCRLRSCGRVGSMLSGGLDSSAIVALASSELARTGRGPLPTFSAVNTADTTCPETAAIGKMRELPGLAPNVFDIADPHAPWADLQLANTQLLEPFDQMDLVRAQYLAANVCRVRVVLDGIDADTVFSEGRMLRRLLIHGRWLKAWREARGGARFHRHEFSAWSFLQADLVALLVPEPLRSLRRRLLRGHRLRVQLRSSLIAADFARRIGLIERLDALASNANYPLRTTLAQEHALAIQGAYLTAGVERYDRVASAHACEPRHPFLDRRLLGLTLALPDEQRQRDGWPKWVLRRAMNDALPPEVCWRRGKEHLGWRANQRLLQRTSPAELDDLLHDRRTLEPWIDMRRLREHVERWQHARDVDSGELICEALILRWWLRRVAFAEPIADAR